MDDNPYASPPAAAAGRSVVPVVFSAVTLVYALAVSCCAVAALPILVSGLDPEATAPDNVLAAVCTLLYMLGLVPAAAGLMRSPWMRALHFGWAASVIVAELASSAVYTWTHDDGWVAAVCSIVMFCSWPAVCLVVLPFVATSAAEA